MKALELQGFKSFSEKTRLTFDKEVTAVVGPNGSGKSNIADALLWVMGEQRTRTLRGGKMEDVIFGGTARRNPMGFAQVTLVLDNSGRIFDIDSDEVMLTRRYYRSGESEYYLNKQSVRLKDITNLLMDTGLGRDGYSVIGQGRIAEIVSARSTDRREIFEEAAGISRYRHRKEEAERKLARTDENLLRIGDKIEELSLQVEPLRVQAEKAKRYLLLRDELRGLEISLWMDTLDRLHEQAAAVQADYEAAKTALDAEKSKLDAMYAGSEQLSERMRECDLRAENLRARISAAESNAAECESAAAVLRTNLKNDSETAERMRFELIEQADRVRVLKEQAEERRTRISEIDAARVQLELRERGLRQQSKELEDGLDDAARALTALLQREKELDSLRTEGRTALGMLADAAQELFDRDTACSADLAAAGEKKTAAQTQLELDQKTADEAAEQVIGLQNAIAGRQMLFQNREARAEKLRDKQMQTAMELRAVDDRITLLRDLEREYEGFNKAVRTVMRETEKGLLRGVYGPVARLVQTDEKYTVAIETALGGAMQNIVVESPEDGKAAIELLKKRDAGRATFLPVQSIRGASLRRVPCDDPGFLGVASELVRYDPRFQGIFQNLLARTVIAESLSDAVRMAKKYDHAFRIVSLDGQVVNAGGSMTG
ncbi:MAG: chromosome segregation protein SMC, partial [Eubacteriales bacterium]|nr:chromosome segregation protein SMC [Eubacteriales bacterium]